MHRLGKNEYRVKDQMCLVISKNLGPHTTVYLLLTKLSYLKAYIQAKQTLTCVNRLYCLNLDFVKFIAIVTCVLTKHRHDTIHSGNGRAVINVMTKY